MRLNSGAVVLAMLMTSRVAAAQERCDALLAQGVFDAYAYRSHNLSQSAFHNAMCNGEIHQRNASSSAGGGGTISVGIPGIVDVALGGSGKDAHALQDLYKKLLCGEASSASVKAGAVESLASVASPVVLQAYNACLAAEAKGLRVNVVRPDLMTVSFELNYSVVRSTATFDALYLNPKTAATCRSANLANGDKIDASSAEIVCARAPGFTAAFTIVLQTSVGAYVYRMPELPRQQLPAATPIGTIVAFSGMAPPPGWRLCDGSSLSKKQYQSLFDVIGYTYGGSPGSDSFTLPDLRGRFLRGLNDGAAGVTRDPKQERQLGSVEDWATATPHAGWTVSHAGSHHHSDGVGQTSPSCEDTVHEKPDRTCGELNIRHGRPLNDDGDHTHAVTGGDAETRPTNLAVRFIIHVGLESPK